MNSEKYLRKLKTRKKISRIAWKRQLKFECLSKFFDFKNENDFSIILIDFVRKFIILSSTQKLIRFLRENFKFYGIFSALGATESEFFPTSSRLRILEQR